MHQRQYQQLINALNNITNEINSLFVSRKKILDNNISYTVNSRPQVTQSFNKQILSHCSKYSQVKKFIQDYTRNPSYFKNQSDLNNGFWQINEKLQKQLERKLKNLKQIDIVIEQLIQKQLQVAGQIQSIEQNIRSILMRKQPNHITKAQPLYLKKQSMFTQLQKIKSQIQSVKEQKLSQLTKILDILNQMKSLRGKRLQQCKQSTLSKQMILGVECLVKDIEQVVQNKRIYQIHEQNQKKILQHIVENNQKVYIQYNSFIKIQKMVKELLQVFDAQSKAIVDINQIFKAKSEISYFHQKIVSYFEVNQSQFLSINEGMRKFIELQNQKNSQVNQILQGINTTQETISIFQNLKRNIETQSLRKRQLMEKIASLNKAFLIEKQRRQRINQKQTKIQGLKINFSKLQTMLSQAAQQADVKVYKQVHSQLDQLSRHIKTESIQLQKTKSAKRQSMRKMLSQTTQMQQQYRDIMSQMFSPIWLRDNDFSKQQTISDFDVYLSKMFSRLKILT